MDISLKIKPTRDDVAILCSNFMIHTTVDNARIYVEAVTDAWWAGNIRGDEMRAHINVVTTALATLGATL